MPKRFPYGATSGPWAQSGSFAERRAACDATEHFDARDNPISLLPTSTAFVDRDLFSGDGNKSCAMETRVSSRKTYLIENTARQCAQRSPSGSTLI